MNSRLLYFVVVMSAACPSASFAGLYYSGESQSALPSQWRGFLTDHRALRLLSAPRPANGAVVLLRDQYQEAARKLEEAATGRPLSADEAADLGALYVRLGHAGRAVELLRAAQRRHPEHFRITANLGTAWQAQGDLSEAAAALHESVRLAPPALHLFEGYHFKLVRLRQTEPKNSTGLDNLFGVTYSGAAGKAPLPVRKELPTDAVAVAQQLALWMPADGRLLWQLGELANAHGDVRTAASILDGCVSEFAMGASQLRKHRQAYRAAADEIAKLPDEEHAQYKGDLVTRSSRPLNRRFDLSQLPPIRPEGVNPLPWMVLAETTVDRGFKPKFARYLEDLDGKHVSLTGFMQPLGTEGDVTGFLLIEYPVGCWFCETPEPTAMVLVTLPPGKVAAMQRGAVKIDGVLKLNRNDPEEFLYTVQNAHIVDPD